MATLTLDDIRESVEREFVSTKIVIGDVEVVMTNPIRMTKDQREKLSAAMEGTEEATKETLEGQFDRMLGIIKAAVPNKTQAKLLIDAIGDDLAVAMKVLDAYLQEQKPGEALGSQD